MAEPYQTGRTLSRSLRDILLAAIAEPDQTGRNGQRAEEQKPYRGTNGFHEIRKRELGLSQPRGFSRRVAGSEALIKRMNEDGKLQGHKDYVGALCFNSNGDVLVSGSDDKHIIFWDCAMRTKILSYNSGHVEYVRRVGVMPFTDDRTVISSGSDRQVRVAEIKEDGQASTKRIGSHEGVFNMAIEPDSSHTFYGSSSYTSYYAGTGVLQRFDLRSPRPTKLFTTSFTLHAIAIDPHNKNSLCVGGCNQYARVYDLRMYDKTGLSEDRPVNLFCPNHLFREQTFKPSICSLSYSNSSELLVNYYDEPVYLFTKNMSLRTDQKSFSQDKLEKIEQPQVYVARRRVTVNGRSFFGLNYDYVFGIANYGRVCIWRKKGGELMCTLQGDKDEVHCAASHPFFPLLATSGESDNIIKLWTPSAGPD